MKSKLIVLLFAFCCLIFLSGVVCAAIASLPGGSIYYPGNRIALVISPTKSGFFNTIYVYKETNVIDIISVPCTTICKQKKTVYYTIPADFLGQYYFATFDYAINDYELDYFDVIEEGGATQGTLKINHVKNAEAGVNGLIYPEQGRNSNISVEVLLTLNKCEQYSVTGYFCNSSINCSYSEYTYQIPLKLRLQESKKCYWTYTGENYFPFYQSGGNWKFFAKSGLLTDQVDFIYTNLIAINYTSAIEFGSLNSQVWNIGLPSDGIDLINFGNVPVAVDWNSAGFSCVSENCTDFWLTYYNEENTFQIDDDTEFMQANETGLNPVFITNFSLNYFPQNNLSVCVSDYCNDSIGEKIRTFFNLKISAVQRGVYQGDIRISLY